MQNKDQQGYVFCFSSDLALQMEFITETHFTAESLGPKQVGGGEFDLIV